MINCNRRDGSARAVNEVAERLALNHEVHLFARKTEDLNLSAVRWHKVPGPGWPEVADFASYHFLANRLIRPGAFDIVHSVGCNTLNANVITIQNVQPAKKRILDELACDEHVSPPRRFTRWLYLRVTSAAERRLYENRANRAPPVFLPVSRGVERELRQYYDIGAAAVRIIPNAADIERFKPVDAVQRRAWREKNCFSMDDFVCIFVGGEWARKGLDLAIKTVSLIHDPRVKLFVAGDDPDRARFLRMAADSGLQGRVLFGGFRDDVPGALASSDLFLFPSRYEAFSLATIEAAACGLPVVAPRINGAEDFILPGETGEFIDHDPIQIAATLKPMIDNPQKCRDMGRAGRKLVEQHYTWDRVAAMTEQAYIEHINRPSISD